MFAPSQWETPLQSNAVSHWLGANIESALVLWSLLMCYFQVSSSSTVLYVVVFVVVRQGTDTVDTLAAVVDSAGQVQWHDRRMVFMGTYIKRNSYKKSSYAKSNVYVFSIDHADFPRLRDTEVIYKSRNIMPVSILGFKHFSSCTLTYTLLRV